MNRWGSKETLRILYILFLGQVVSLNLAFTALTASLLADIGVDAPLTQSFFTYLLLALVYGAILLYRRQKLQVPWYWYIPLGFIDVQGNYLVIKAFQYSSITSVTILDCWTIPWVIILTWIFIGTRYSLWQYLGAAACVIGLGLVLLSDAGVGGGGGEKPLLGDVLVIAGTLCYAMSNVGEEYCVKKKDRVEVVAMLGVFGLLVSICQISMIERKDLEAVQWSTDIILLFAGYALSTFIFYSIVPFVLKMSGATMFNLSLLTSDMWAVLIRIFIYHQKVDWLYYLAFGVVALGLVIYSVTEKDPVPATAIEDGNPNIHYQPLNEANEESSNETFTT
ncbi:PREDICTED: solute carrier family 35 member F1-like [Nelumbo nucifera]|uniref:Solute carrier family 35 member F1-like n=1 Tax=Nelumbo nucifera TaxID=4432 RepID=A0A1U7ZB30_NELNU|nr:PREDICTED: solute carrier family 35 member F1-like [Nelumbo nucifera]